jgi:hypothetical protein
MNPKILKKFTDQALKKLKGDWVIIGGTVLPLVNIDYRVTVDIDMIPLAPSGNEELLTLMQLAEALGLPVESINPAGGFFLKKIKDWRKRLIIHSTSNTCKIYRPNFDLFLELKLARFSETDESDIIEYLKWHQKNDFFIDRSKCLDIIKKLQKKNQAEEKRLIRLEKLIQSKLLR